VVAAATGSTARVTVPVLRKRPTSPGLSAPEGRRGNAKSGAANSRAVPPYDYLKDPAAIYRRSFALIRREVDLARIPRALQGLAIRLVHASGEPALLKDLHWSDDAARRARAAFASRAPIFVDSEMVAAGIQRRERVHCLLNDRRVPRLARTLGTTRSAAAVELWRADLAGAVVAIGNAPTALFHLLEMIAAGAPRPAIILGFPVGFVGAAESKEALAGNSFSLPYVTLLGRRGGSALAAAAWGTGVTWGADAVKGTSGDGDDDNIVWGTACGGADCVSVVWGADCSGDADCDNIVWGTSCDADTDCDNIVWGTNVLDPAEDVVWSPVIRRQRIPATDVATGGHS